jgi:hypothetical protein
MHNDISADSRGALTLYSMALRPARSANCMRRLAGDASPAAFPVPLAIIDGGMAAPPGLPAWVAVREYTAFCPCTASGRSARQSVTPARATPAE